MLGAAHHLGSGVEADQRAALTLLLRAQAGGSDLAARFIDRVRALLSPEDIAAARDKTP